MRGEDDDALYFHRLALFHEEMRIEDFAVLAQTVGIQTSRPRPYAAAQNFSQFQD